MFIFNLSECELMSFWLLIVPIKMTIKRQTAFVSLFFGNALSTIDVNDRGEHKVGGGGGNGG